MKGKAGTTCFEWMFMTVTRMSLANTRNTRFTATYGETNGGPTTFEDTFTTTHGHPTGPLPGNCNLQTSLAEAYCKSGANLAQAVKPTSVKAQVVPIS